MQSQRANIVSVGYAGYITGMLVMGYYSDILESRALFGMFFGVNSVLYLAAYWADSSSVYFWYAIIVSTMFFLSGP